MKKKDDMEKLLKDIENNKISQLKEEKRKKEEQAFIIAQSIQNEKKG